MGEGPQLPRSGEGPRAWPWLLLYAAGALGLTWPLAGSLGRALPLGELREATVPWFNLWTLEWNADRLAHGYAGYWDAPIFFPERGSFALSEPQPLTGAVFALLRPWLGSAGAYGVLLWLALCGNALAMRRLARLAGVSARGAGASGLLVLALPFALKELGVLQLVMLWPPLLVLCELVRVLREPRALGVRTGLRAAAAFVVTLWTCVYYALFLTLLLALAALWMLLRPALRAGLHQLSPRALLLALGVLAAGALPLVSAQRAALREQARSDEAVREGSATVRAYLRVPARTLAARALPQLAARPGKRSLYPGVVLVLLAALGARAQWRGPGRELVRFALAAALLSLLVSFGTRAQLAGFAPYAWTLQRAWPGFALLRSPYRMAAFVQLMLALLAAFGCEALDARVRNWAARAPSRLSALAASAALPCVLALALLEVARPLPLRTVPQRALHAPFVTWLAQHPGGAVAMVPPARSGKSADLEPTALAMLQGLRHGHPLVNGYSGFFPKRSEQLARGLRRFPRPQGLDALARLGVRYVVVERAFLAERAREKDLRAAWWEPLREVFASPSHVIYELSAP